MTIFLNYLFNGFSLMHADDTTREYMTSKAAKIQVGLLGIFSKDNLYDFILKERKKCYL